MPRLILLLGFVLLSSLSAPAAEKKNAPAQSRAPLPSGVSADRDVAYVLRGHERQKLNIYWRSDGPARPLLIWIHGGAWRGGSKDGYQPNRALEWGYTVAAINYRLSQHAIFPAQIEDCKAAIRFLRAHAARYNFDPERVGVFGSSAGGHLVALLGTSGGVETFEVGAHRDQSSRVQAVVDLFGPTDFLQMGGTHLNAGSPESALLGGRPTEKRERVRQANPITYITPDDPPFLILHGEADMTVIINQSELLHAALQKAGVPSTFIRLPGVGHNGGAVFQQAGDRIRDFFAEHLRPAR